MSNMQNIPNIDAIPDLVELTNTVLEFIEFEDNSETQNTKLNNRGYYNYMVEERFDKLPTTMIKLLSEKDKRTENLSKILDMIDLLKNVKSGKTSFEKAENEFVEKRAEEYLYPQFGGKDNFYKIAEENKKKQEKSKKK
jgi:hypothetical protein